MSVLLVVDDELDIRELIAKYAKFSGYEVVEAENGFNAIEKAKATSPDVIVMDVMMPGLDGFGAVKEIKKFSSAPIIMLSARGEEYDKLYGFELGVDDYVTKPFSPRELMARIGVVIKRNEAAAKPQEHEKIVVEGLEIDVSAHEVFIDGQRAQMTPKEYDLLFYLARNRGVAKTREQLLSDVWGLDYFGEDRTVDTHIKMLRHSLGKYRDHVVTKRGFGYKFE